MRHFLINNESPPNPENRKRDDTMRRWTGGWLDRLSGSWEPMKYGYRKTSQPEDIIPSSGSCVNIFASCLIVKDPEIDLGVTMDRARERKMV